jgi:hydroxymethylpyrimidine pyrophosphatase-like HAD family hydrolase
MSRSLTHFHLRPLYSGTAYSRCTYAQVAFAIQGYSRHSMDFEAICPSVHKGEALRQICESLGTVTPEQGLAFGDGENDIDMFRTAGYSVAMGNAMPAAVAAAKYTTTRNDEGGVGNFLEKVWNVPRDPTHLQPS